MGCGSAVLGIVAFVVLAGLGGPAPVSAGVYSLVLVALLSALVLRVGRMRGQRRPWALVAAGALLLGVCQLALVWACAGGEAVLPITVFLAHPLTAFAGLSAYPLLYAGQMGLLRQRVAGVMPSAWLDGLLAALLLSAVACAFVLPSLWATAGLGLLAGSALALRPLFDLLMTLFSVANWSLSGWRTDRRLPVLTVALGLLTIADAIGVARVTGYLSAWTPVEINTGVDAARLLAVLLVVLAASREEAVRTGVMVRWSSIAGPALVMIAGLVLVVVNEVRPLGGAAVVLAAAALAGVGVKLILLFREVLALADSRRQALSDELTGLGNRRALRAALAEAWGAAGHGTVDSSERASCQVALVLMDLNGFKAVNDRLGHTAGDALLRSTADRLRECVPTAAVLARLGGDEFAILLTGSDALDAEGVAARATAAVAARSGSGHGGMHLPAVTASTGVAVVDRDQLALNALALPAATARAAVGFGGGVDPGEELLRRADVAMYRAKAAGGGVRVFDLADDRAARERDQLVDDLRAALEADAARGYSSSDPAAQIVVHYQPQLDARTGRVEGVEALVRWRHPDHGILGPDTFLPLAEEHGLVAPITTRVMHTAAADVIAWNADGHRLRVAVNLSTSCLTNPALLPLVDAVLTGTGLDPALLVVEVTETTLMADPQQAIATAVGIRQRGVQLSIDDYGTGYSSLSYLSDLPATELKLDRSFTSRILTDRATRAIVTSTVQMAHDLGLRLVAEGVEDEATRSALAVAGCDETQGYLHTRPVPAAALTRWLLDHERADDEAPADA